MSIPYFYQQDLPTYGSFLLNEETSKHCIQVLRMKTGEQLNLTNGNGSLVQASIEKQDKKHCEVKLQSSSFQPKEGRNVSIAISLLKNTSRFEWFLEKATELGVSEIIPLLCKRTEKQQFRQDRMNNIVIAAMLQSQQVWLPILHIPTDIKTIINQQEPNLQRLMAHCESSSQKQTIPTLALQEYIQILIGPEGDFTSEEIELALTADFLPTSLGNTRLRTETAGIVAATLLVNN